MISIKVSVRKIILVLSAIVAVLTVAGAAAMFTKLLLDRSIFGFMHLLDLSWEDNVPTWYASAGLLLCAVLLFIIAQIEEGKRGWEKHWYGLSGIFLFLSADETAAIHERAGTALERIVPVIDAMGGALKYSWVVLGGIAVIIVTVFYIRFFVNLPRSTQMLFFLAAASFVGGALGLEMVNAWIDDTYGNRTVAYVGLTVIEEMLEMVGVLIFAYALVDYIRESVSGVQFTFGEV